jgi:hypothetical protein
MSRADVDTEEDVPTFGFPSDENVSSKSWEIEHKGEKLFRIEGELWRNEWVDPAAASPLVRGDKVESTVSFIVDAAGKRETAKTLVEGSRWLWFRPEVMPAIAHRRGGSLGWYTKDTGEIEGAPGYGVHFGINHVGLVNVYAKDIALLPDWLQRLWAGYNVAPDGGVSEELLASQMRAEPAKTKAPEAFLGRSLDWLNTLGRKLFGIQIVRPHDDHAAVLSRAHRFRATDLAGLYALAKDLARLTADSFDEASIQTVVKPPAGTKWRGLKSLENLLGSRIGADAAREMMGPLFAIYDLRLADAHLPSSGAADALKRAGVDASAPFVVQGFRLLHVCVGTLYRIGNALQSKIPEK